MKMQPRHKIDKEYESNPRHIRRWELTLNFLMKYGVDGNCLDCGDRTEMTEMIEDWFSVKVKNTEHNLDWFQPGFGNFDNVFIFEIIEHLINPGVLFEWLKERINPNTIIYLSTPINRPKWMRNKQWHFHEFNYNELEHLIDQSGFKIVDEKRINCTRWYYMFTGFRPLLRVLGFDKNILMRLERK